MPFQYFARVITIAFDGTVVAEAAGQTYSAIALAAVAGRRTDGLHAQVSAKAAASRRVVEMPGLVAPRLAALDTVGLGIPRKEGPTKRFLEQH